MLPLCRSPNFFLIAHPNICPANPCRAVVKKANHDPLPRTYFVLGGPGVSMSMTSRSGAPNNSSSLPRSSGD
jgi:hypothetical protein